MDFNKKLSRAIDKFGEQTAIVDKHNRLTYSDTGKAIDDMVLWLEKKGCVKGDRVATLALNCNELLILEWAIYRLECIWVSIPSLMREVGVVEKILLATQPKLFLIGPDSLPAFYPNLFRNWSQAHNQEDLEQETISDPIEGLMFEQFTYLRNLKAGPGPFLKGQKNILRFRYTSGSGGTPKGIAYSRSTVNAYLDNIGQQLGDQSLTVVHGLPTVWASGSLTLPVLFTGGKSAVVPKWDTRAFTNLVFQEEGNLTFLVPRVLQSLIEYTEKVGSGWSSSLKQVIIAGAPVSVRLMQKALELFHGLNSLSPWA